jgi:hypothetical protein
MNIVWGRSIGWNIELHGYKKRKMGYTIITNGCDCYPWHEVFAWWPVKTVNNQTVWLKKVYKRKVWIVWGTGFHMEPETQYGTVFDMLTYTDETMSAFGK